MQQDLPQAADAACRRRRDDRLDPDAGDSGTATTAQTMVATLNIAGDSAGMKNRCSALSIAIITAAMATIARNGNMMRVSRIVSSIFPGTPRNPSAYSRTSGSANRMPATTTAPETRSSTVMTFDASRQAAALSPRRERRVNVGTSAALSAPSANKSRSTFGRRNAMRNASIASPAPKK